MLERTSPKIIGSSGMHAQKSLSTLS